MRTLLSDLLQFNAVKLSRGASDVIDIIKKGRRHYLECLQPCTHKEADLYKLLHVVNWSKQKVAIRADGHFNVGI